MKLAMQVDLSHGHIVLDVDPAPLPQKGHGPSPNFRPISVEDKWLDGIKMPLGTDVGLGLATLC